MEVDDRPTLRENDLISNLDVFRGANDPHADTPVRMSVHQLDSHNIPVEVSILDLDFIHVQLVSSPRDERVQYVINSADNGKAYYFGRTMKVYTFSGFMIDSNLGENQDGSEVDFQLRGHLLSYWKSVWERYLRAGVAVKNKYVVKIPWKDITIFGIFLSSGINLDASRPNLITINGTIVSLWEDNPVSLYTVLSPSGRETQSALTKEAYDLIFFTSPSKQQPFPISALGSLVADRSRVSAYLREIPT